MHCAICDGSKVTIQKEGKYSFAVCATCQVRYHYPLPSNAFLATWYSKEAFSKRWRGKLLNAIQTNYEQNKEIFGLYFSLIKEKITIANKKILDIGCYDGKFLQQFKSAGATCVGIDLNSGLIEHGKATGLDLHVGTLEGSKFDTESFDIITFNQVLEHLNNPIAFINEVKRVLKPTGVVEFSVPDYTVNKKIDFPNHLFHFVTLSLQKLVNRTGFSCNIIEEKAQKAIIVVGKKIS